MCRLLYSHGGEIKAKNSVTSDNVLHCAVFSESLTYKQARNETMMDEYHDVVKWALTLPYTIDELYHYENNPRKRLLDLARYPPTRTLVSRRMVGETLLVLRSTLFCPRLATRGGSKKLRKLTPDHYRLVGLLLVE